MGGTGNLVAALVTLLGFHYVMSHILRKPIIEKVGQRNFILLFSALATAIFVWVILAFARAPATLPLWPVSGGHWWLATVLMLIASILFVGSLFGNPSVPNAKTTALIEGPAKHVFAITRHPMMWGFAIWSAVHLLVSPQEKVIILTVGVGLLALVGSWGQQRRKLVSIGAPWADWLAKTSFVPFGRQVAGKAPWKTAWPGRRIFLLGVLFWLVVSYGHSWFGIAGAGIWRWLW